MKDTDAQVVTLPDGSRWQLLRMFDIFENETTDYHLALSYEVVGLQGTPFRMFFNPSNYLH